MDRVTNLFLLTSNLFQLNDKEKIILKFIEGMNEIFKPSEFNYFEKEGPGSITTLELRTRKSFYGVITVNLPVSEDNIPENLIADSVQMLAVILEHLDFEQKLEKERDLINGISIDKLAEIERNNEDLEQARKASINLIEDLTDEIEKRKNAEQLIRESEQKFRNLFENSPVGKSMTGIDGTINVNESFSKILGYSEEELRTKNWRDISHPDDLSFSDEIVKSLLEGKIESARFEKRYINKNGNIVYTDLTTYLQHDNKGNPQFFITTISDITEQKKGEAEIKELNAGLEEKVKQRTSQLEASNKELEAFSYSVSHDLRAPLRAIHSFTGILKEDFDSVLDDEGKRICGIIESSAVHMGQLIDDLLALSRIGRTEISCSEIDMNKMVKNVITDEISPEDRLKLSIRIDRLPPVFGDSPTIKQVITNLISNAVKYTSKTEKPEIIIGCDTSQNKQVYYVKDNGVGFDMKYHNKLFGVFQRLHSSVEFEGNGVGLAIVQRIIHRHGGSAWAEAEVGKGATFYFTLPGNEANDFSLL